MDVGVAGNEYGRLRRYGYGTVGVAERREPKPIAHSKGKKRKWEKGGETMRRVVGPASHQGALTFVGLLWFEMVIGGGGGAGDG